MSPVQCSLSRKMSIAAACAAVGAFGLGVVPGTARPALAAVPANQAARSAVALAVGPAGSGYAFYRGQGDAVYLRTVRNGTWSGFTRTWAPAAPPPPASRLSGTDWTRITERQER